MGINIHIVKSLATYDEEDNQLTPVVLKTEEELELEKNIVLTEMAAEIQAKVDAYEAAKEHQRLHGDPGPVADFDIMKICNEHNGQFEVVFREKE